MVRQLAVTCLFATALSSASWASDLGMLLTDVDIRFNRASAALKENLQLTLEDCSNAEKSVCRFKVNDSLAIIATSPGPGRNLEQLVGIYVAGRDANKRDAVLMNELMVAMTMPDLGAKERVGLVDTLLGQTGKADKAEASLDRHRFRLEVTPDKSLFIYVEPVR